jgi:hypothetical protein
MTFGHGYLMIGEIFLHLKRVGVWLIVQTLKKRENLKNKIQQRQKIIIVGFVHVLFS